MSAFLRKLILYGYVYEVDYSSVITISLHDYSLLSLVLKCTLFETTKKGLINSPVKYGHPLLERPNINV